MFFHTQCPVFATPVDGELSNLLSCFQVEILSAENLNLVWQIDLESK